MGASKRSIRQFFKGPLLVVMTAWLLLALDPLQIEEAMTAQSEETATRLASIFYPPLSDLDSPVTVILLDPAYIAASGKKWPVSYRAQGELLRKVAGYHPKGVFVDLLYNTPHSDPLDDPAEMFELAGPDSHVPFFIAARTINEANCARDDSVTARAFSPAPMRLLPGFREWAERSGGGLAFVEWNGCGDKYPLRLGADPSAPTPAAALWSLEPNAKLDRKPIYLRWGALPPSQQRAMDDENRCMSGYEPVDDKNNHTSIYLHRIGMEIRELLLSAVRAQERSSDYRCPAVNMLSAAAVVDPDLDTNSSALKGLLAGKFVLIGADVPGSGDYMQSSVHGLLPGVLMHAMALDNLKRLHEARLERISPAFMNRCFTLVVLLTVAALVYWLPLHRCFRILQTIGIVFLGAFGGYWIARGEFEISFLAVASGWGLFIIAPTSLARSLVSFVALYLFTVCFMSLTGTAPTAWLVTAAAAVLAGEKIYDEVHGESERAIVRGRLEHLKFKRESQ
jgi:CHASE2 domain-containing sensor protein